MFENLTIAAIVPCFNEEATVATVVGDLRRAVPAIQVFVYDNRSTDRTAEVAAAAGAVVRYEERKGKGNVVRRAFADIEADVYLLIDGDDTYAAEAAPVMITTLLDGPYDHVLGCRVDQPEKSAYRPGHAQGNRLFNRLVSMLFGERVTDMLSGYRVFSRRFVKSFPALSTGFEIETELTVHSMALRVPQREVGVGFSDRPEGSESKLNTFSDGFRILRVIVLLVAHERPFLFYGVWSALVLVLGLVFGLPVVAEFVNTGVVERLPSAVLAAALVTLSVMSLAIGAILSGVLKGRREAMRLAYLRLGAVGSQRADRV
ncbi:glycosyltransferase involved in cell wall biosynthesis [Leucobacter luti]|uniref:glycosyltransferase n=1 Tax=Leucobacter luti TaxID=340320 RepID=UPI0010D8B5EC|nr:glycosyltransferase [Leucobacter luti]MCW2289839.1 glycosyltransferase involved in cell wall biosynthesis [Leucobacter luti]TCK36008.1 glycosyltransferase involved in cell wall biosynthesis [Leucobacter luti]